MPYNLMSFSALRRFFFIILLGKKNLEAFYGVNKMKIKLCNSFIIFLGKYRANLRVFSQEI